MISRKDSKEVEMEMLNLRNEMLRGENDKLKATLDYVAMMTDVELPEDKGGNDESLA